MTDLSPPSGGAHERPMTVQLEPDGRVRSVTLQGLPERLRQPRPLADELSRALAEAHADRLPEPDSAVQAGRVTARRVVAPPRRPLREMIDAQRRTPSVTQLSRRPLGTARGVSGNGCVTVTLDPGGPGGAVDADPGWLRQAPPSKVAAAISEAFADGYRERESR